MSARKPIIGLAGGICSGKSFVGKLFADFGCLVISSDDHVREIYRRPDIKQTLRTWWGDKIFLPNGEIDRTALAAKVFSDDGERQKLETLIHPLVAQRRDEIMKNHENDPAIKAFIWDIPLLFETGLHQECDAVVFVDSTPEDRLQRVQCQRSWTASELARREKAQWPLDKKREISDYVISNTADAGFVRDQIRNVLSQILSKQD